MLGCVVLAVVVGGSLLGWRLVGGSGAAASATTGSSSTTSPSTVTSTVTSSGQTPSAQSDLIAQRDRSYTPVKGLYVTSSSAASSTTLARLINIADTTEINALVIDVKDNSGYVTYNSSAPLALQYGTVRPVIKDIDSLIATLKQHNIIPIARLVCFQDSVLAKKQPQLAIKDKKTGGNWLDRKKAGYTNPYNRQVWEYLTEVAEDAAKHGFSEIQFDYVRFPSDGLVVNAMYPGENGPKEDAIAGFLAFARPRLEKLGVWVSADVFGLVVHEKGDGGIGQHLETLAPNIDILCPMIYPSHYTKGYYNLPNPNAAPYQLITDALKETKTRLAGTGAMGRPWIQDFTLGQPPYGVTQVKAELQAVADQGFDEFILWNAANKYTVGALAPN